tara:strand:- start:370 stop:546 length:177 start_codon:yes stop_codon:yes gene_type:complete
LPFAVTEGKPKSEQVIEAGEELMREGKVPSGIVCLIRGEEGKVPSGIVCLIRGEFRGV